MKKPRPQNAATMTKAALVKEVRAARKKIAAQGEELKDLKAEIARRDNATKHFREIEPLAIGAAFIAYPTWEAEGYPFGMYGLNYETANQLEAMLSNIGEDFWKVAAFNRAEDYLQAMKKAKEKIGR